MMEKRDQKFLLLEIYNGTLFSGIFDNISEKFTEFLHVKINTELATSYSAQEELILTISKIIRGNNISPLHTRVYWSVQFDLDPHTALTIRKNFYMELGVNLNIVPLSTRNLYLIRSNALTDSILYGVCKKEFQRVVICGSFRKHLGLVKDVYNYCRNKDIEVLSPQNLQYDSVFNESFVLFHGEKIVNERETYWIEHKHTKAIYDADAVIICNSEGYIGPTTIYEIGFAQALGKRIVFVDENCGEFDIYFPRDTGLLGF